MAPNFSGFVRFVLIRSNRLESTTFLTHLTHPSPPKSRSTLFSNRQKGKRFVSIRWNKAHKSISGLSNRKYQRQIDSSWVYWTTLCNAYLLGSTEHVCTNKSRYHPEIFVICWLGGLFSSKLWPRSKNTALLRSQFFNMQSNILKASKQLNKLLIFTISPQF